jgi:UDP-N-acetylglucosamine 3-dehydrogenase
MMGRQLRAGLVGLGAMGRHHARLLRQIDGVELVAVSDQSGDAFGVADGLPVLPTVEALIAEGIDLAVVAVPTTVHEAVAIELADAGIHTLIEKPVAGSADAARRLIEHFDRRGLVGAVGHVERFNPAIVELKRRIDAGELGVIRQISTRRQGPFPARIADVGVAMDLGPHDFDLTAWLAGSGYETVFAQALTPPEHRHEAMVTVSGRLQNGVIASNTLSWLSALRERTVVVSGSRGTLLADTGATTLHWFDTESPATITDGTAVPLAAAEPLKAELEAFRDAVRGAQSRVATLGDGLASVAVIEATLHSTRTGWPVEVDVVAAVAGPVVPVASVA